jgi:hypothetical protein
MSVQRIFDQPLPWSGAQATLANGKPLMIRFRQFPGTDFAEESLPIGFVLVYRYPPSNPSGLPSREQYNAIAEFEVRVFDRVEQLQLGILAMARTSGGVIRYLCYIRETIEAAQFFTRVIRGDDPTEMEAVEDRSWGMYHRAMNFISKSQG